MYKIYSLIAVVLIIFTLNSCSKKNHPSKTLSAKENASNAEKGNDSAIVKKTVAKRKSIVLPNVITVNDSAARKSVDGRYYYDVMGHRYWHNNKDGKYYLFNKSMYNNPDFKKPDN